MNLIERAHQTARAKGFWNDGGSEFPTKAALIATEIREFEMEAFERRPDAALEELADVVIRTLDLLGYPGLGDEKIIDEPGRWIEYDEPSLALELYRLVADATINHRNGNEVLCSVDLDDIIRHAARYVSARYGPGKLREAIEAKMDKNEKRPRMHGKPY